MVILPLLAALALQADAPREADVYPVVTLAVPDDVVLEVSGLAVLADGRPLVATRRGQVFVLDGAYAPDGEGVRYTRYADGLQEPLGLLEHAGWIWVTQRGELSRMRDTDGDDRMDELETVCDAWRISGNYHEYDFGPRLDHDGNLWITLNKPFGDEPFGRVAWRGFALKITPDGEWTPMCAGLRSPAGVEVAPWGDVFYTDNQGEWCGASKLAHLEPGDFHGHPWGMGSCDLDEWKFPVPKPPPDGMPMPEVAKRWPGFKLPAVWFPYDKMGQSPAGMVWDTTGGAFGPFAGQLFVADQHHASVMRVSLERVKGRWQGACYPFREGLQCGALRLAWGEDHSLFVGQTNRGWGSKGGRTEGLERITWSGVVPFEVHAMSAVPGGFELALTQPVDRERAADTGAYRLTSYTYLLHSTYGSPETDTRALEVTAAEVSADGLRVRLAVEGLRAGYVHELHADGLRSADGLPLLHPEAYYTLIELAE